MHRLFEKYCERTAALPALIDAPARSDTRMFITVPAMAEPDLKGALESLAVCDPVPGYVEVIVVINHPEGASDTIVRANNEAYELAVRWAAVHSGGAIGFHILRAFDLPQKTAGVGHARKIAMDEALRRALDIEGNTVPIVGYDADCRVARNYLVEIDRYFSENQDIEGCSIHFEHRIEGLEEVHVRAIRDYEKHLRFYIGGLRWAGHPFAFQTIGSAMAVRAQAYLEVGGMNKRKAGEDFYFLQKVIERGRFGELESAVVYPSARVSDRVPFGTGKAVGDVLSGNEQKTYNPESYRDIRALIESLPDLLSAEDTRPVIESLPEPMRDFLLAHDAEAKIREVREHTASVESRRARFFKWFNAFRAMKYLHYARDRGREDVPVKGLVAWLDDL